MGSIDIPPFLRDKMKQNIQDNSDEIDIPDFLKKKDSPDYSGKRPSSYPLSDGSNPSTSPSNPPSQSQKFDPATFMRQSRAAVLSNKPAQDNQSTQVAAQHQIVQKTVQKIQKNQANAVKAKPVTQSAQIQAQPDEPFDLTKSLQTDFPDTDPNEVLGNKDLLSGYYRQKNDLLQGQIDQMEASEKRGVMTGAIAKLKKEQQALTQQVYHYNSIHAGLEGGGDPTQTGIILGKAMGDPHAAQQERFIQKGIPVNPMQAVKTEDEGLGAQIATLQAQHQYDQGNPEYLAQLADLQNKKATVLERHPEALKEQWGKVIGNYVAKDLPAWQKLSGLWFKRLPDVIEKMRKDGIDVPDEVAKNISWDDVPTNMDIAGKVLEGAVGHFSEKAASLERIGGNLLGIDKDVLDSDIEQGQANLNRNFGLNTPESEQRVAPQETVQANPKKPDFLQNVPNPDAGKINPSGSVLAGEVFKNISSLATFVLDATSEAKIAGNVLNKLSPAMNIERTAALSQHIGTDATVFAGAYEGNYQKAAQIIGDNPDDEGKRNLAAMLGSSIDAAVFHLPIGKYGQNLTEGKMAMGDVIKNLPPNLKGLTAESLETNLKKYLQKPLAAILESAKNTTGEAVKFGAMQTAGVVLKKIAQSAVANNDESDKDWQSVPNEIADMWGSLPISLVPGVFGINLLGAGKVSAFSREAKYDAFSNPQRTLSDLGKAQEAGLITPSEFKERAEVIKVGAKILKEAPTTNPETGEPLSHSQSVTWVNNRLQEYALEAKKTGIKDDKVLSKFYDGKIKELQAERESILKPEVKMDVKPGTEMVKDIAPEPAEKTAGKAAEPVSSPVVSEKDLNKEPTIRQLQELNDVHKNLAGQYLKRHNELVKDGLRGDELNNHPDLVSLKEQMGKIEDYFSKPETEKISSENDIEKPNSVGDTEIIKGKPAENTDKIAKDGIVKAEDNITIGEVIDKPITFNGERATLYQDGQILIAKIEGKEKEYEVGNINEVKDKPISEFNIEHEASVVSTNEKGNIVVRGKEYKNNFSDPLSAINADKDGNIISVNLENSKGEKRTFRGNIAEDIAYQIHLKEITKNNESKLEFEDFINKDKPVSKEMDNGGFPKIAEKEAIKDNEPVQLKKIVGEPDILQRPAEDKPEPGKGERQSDKGEQLEVDELGKIAFARSNSFEVFKVIHPEMGVDDYNKLRSLNVNIPIRELRKLGREYLNSHQQNETASTEKFYDEIAGSKPTNTGRIPVSPIIGKPKHLSDILLDVSKSLKQKIFFLKPGRGAAGIYSPGSGAIKIRFTGDLDVTAHEIGHSIDDNFKVLAELKNNPDPAITLELSKFSPFGSKPPKGYHDPESYIRAEGFAEWLRAFIVNPDATIKQAPKIYELYQSKVSEPYKKALQNFSNDVRTWAGSTGKDMVLSNIQWEPQKAKGLLKEIFAHNDSDMFSISWADKLAANWVNPMKAFEKAFQYAKGIKGIDEVLPDKDPTILARLFLSVDRKFGEFLEHGLRSAKDELLKDEAGKAKTFKWLIEPLDNTDMATIKKEMEDVTSFMVAERTVELANKFSRESILTGIGGGIYKDVDVAMKALEEFQEEDPVKLKRIKEAAKRYREFSNDVMEYMVDKGRLSKEAFNLIKQNNVQYVALQRILEAEPGTEVQIFKGETRKLSSVNQPIQDIKGSTRKIINPYTSLLDSMHKSLKESDRNEVLRAFRDMIVSQRGMYEGSTKKLSEVGVIAKAGDKNTIIVFVDGKPEKWVLQEDVYKALKGLDNDGFKLPGVLTLHAKVLRSMTTKFPVFAIKNWQRDLQDRLIKSNDHSGVGDLFGDKEHWRDVARKGGLNSGYYVRDKAHYYGLMEQAMDEIAKNQKTIFADPIKIKKLWHGYENILESAETSNRVAEYRAAFKQAKLKGMDDYNAGLYGAFKSRDLMDFAVAGHYMKMVNQMIPFSNAAVQGVRSSLVRLRENPAGFLVRSAIYSVMPQVALWWWNHRDEETAKEYENLPLYQRDMFYNTKLGDNKWLAIPKPYELGMLGSGVDRGLSLAYGFNDDAYKGYAGNIFKAVSPVDPSIMGGPLQPLIEATTNYDFFRDKNIITPNEDVLNLSLRHTETASWLSQHIQTFAGIDARKIDYIIRSQFSYVGNEGLKAIDKSVELIGGKEHNQRTDFDITDLGVFKRSPAYNSPAVQNMIEFAKEWKLNRGKDYREFQDLAGKYFDATTDEDKDDYAKQMIDFSNFLMNKWKRENVEEKAKRNFKK